MMNTLFLNNDTLNPDFDFLNLVIFLFTESLDKLTFRACGVIPGYRRCS